MADGTLNFDLLLNTNSAEKKLSDLLGRLEKKGVNLKINSQPLGKITGQVGEFEKSLAAANARVIAFGASVGIFATITSALKSMATEAINVEKAIAEIQVQLQASPASLKRFADTLFDIGKNSTLGFNKAAEAAKEFSRQGLSLEQTAIRTADALLLTRLGSLDLEKSVASLTATLNSFNKEGLDSSKIVNTLVNVDTKFAVSSKDLAEALARSAESAQSAGVGFNELIGLVTTLQERTSRGGAVIGNALKTIFTRTQRSDTLDELEKFGVAVRDVAGNTLPAIRILEGLANVQGELTDTQRSFVTELTAGGFQINQLKSALSDLSSRTSIFSRATKEAANSQDEANKKAAELNRTLDAQLKQAGVNLQKLAATVGGNIFGPVLKNLTSQFNSLFDGNVSGLESAGAKLGEGLLQGLGNFISGPGLVFVVAALGKLTARFVSFAKDAFGSVVGFGEGSQRIQNIVVGINQLLGQVPGLNKAIESTTLTRAQKEELVLAIIERQVAASQRLAAVQSQLATGLFNKGVSANPSGQFNTKGVPRFADPLREAIGREVRSGVPASSIRIGSSGTLKSSGNPLGLGVFNTIDEPGGLGQGISRAQKEGRNPRTYNIPSFADSPFKLESSILGSRVLDRTLKNELDDLLRQIKSNASSFNQLKPKVDRLIREFALTASSASSVRTTFENAEGRRPGTAINSAQAASVRIQNAVNPLANQLFLPIRNPRAEAPHFFPKVRLNDSIVAAAVRQGQRRQAARNFQPRFLNPDNLSNQNRSFVRSQISNRDPSNNDLLEELLGFPRVLPSVRETKSGFGSRARDFLNKSIDFSSAGAKLREFQSRAFNPEKGGGTRAALGSFLAPTIAGGVSQLFKDDKTKNLINGLGSAVGTGASLAAVIPGPAGLVIGGLVGSFQGLKTVIDSLKPSLEDFQKSLKEKVGRLNEDLQSFNDFATSLNNFRNANPGEAKERAGLQLQRSLRAFPEGESFLNKSDEAIQAEAERRGSQIALKQSIADSLSGIFNLTLKGNPAISPLNRPRASSFVDLGSGFIGGRGLDSNSRESIVDQLLTLSPNLDKKNANRAGKFLNDPDKFLGALGFDSEEVTKFNSKVPELTDRLNIVRDFFTQLKDIFDNAEVAIKAAPNVSKLNSGNIKAAFASSFASRSSSLSNSQLQGQFNLNNAIESGSFLSRLIGNPIEAASRQFGLASLENSSGRFANQIGTTNQIRKSLGNFGQLGVFGDSDAARQSTLGTLNSLNSKDSLGIGDANELIGLIQKLDRTGGNKQLQEIVQELQEVKVEIEKNNQISENELEQAKKLGFLAAAQASINKIASNFRGTSSLSSSQDLGNTSAGRRALSEAINEGSNPLFQSNLRLGLQNSSDRRGAFLNRRNSLISRNATIGRGIIDEFESGAIPKSGDIQFGLSRGLINEQQAGQLRGFRNSKQNQLAGAFFSQRQGDISGQTSDVINNLIPSVKFKSGVTSNNIFKDLNFAAGSNDFGGLISLLNKLSKITTAGSQGAIGQALGSVRGLSLQNSISPLAAGINAAQIGEGDSKLLDIGAFNKGIEKLLKDGFGIDQVATVQKSDTRASNKESPLASFDKFLQAFLVQNRDDFEGKLGALVNALKGANQNNQTFNITIGDAFNNATQNGSVSQEEFNQFVEDIRQYIKEYFSTGGRVPNRTR